MSDLRTELAALTDEMDREAGPVVGYFAGRLRALLDRHPAPTACVAGLHASQCQGCGPDDCAYAPEEDR